MEVEIWDNIHVLVFKIEGDATAWLKSETTRINIETQHQIDVIISVSTAQISAVRVEWTLKIEQEIEVIKVNARLEIDTSRDYWHAWAVAEVKKLEDAAWATLNAAEIDINAEVTITIQGLHT